MLCMHIASGKIGAMAKKVENEKNVKKFLYKQVCRKRKKVKQADDDDDEK